MTLENGIISVVVYGTLGIGMSLISFKVIDFITPGDLKSELTEKQNTALALVLGAHIIAIGIIIAASITG